jgi:hypothetical protein
MVASPFAPAETKRFKRQLRAALCFGRQARFGKAPCRRPVAAHFGTSCSVNSTPNCIGFMATANDTSCETTLKKKCPVIRGGITGRS